MVASNPIQRFSNRVENYLRYRPGYPRAILDALREVPVDHLSERSIGKRVSKIPRGVVPDLVLNAAKVRIDELDDRRPAAARRGAPRAGPAARRRAGRGRGRLRSRGPAPAPRRAAAFRVEPQRPPSSIRAFAPSRNPAASPSRRGGSSFRHPRPSRWASAWSFASSFRGRRVGSR